MRAEALFDFGSPNFFLAYKVLPQIEARTGAAFTYTPVLLGGIFKAANNKSPMVAYADIPNKLAYERLETQRFVKRHGIAFQKNPFFPVNTLMIMRVATAAWLDGGLPQVIEASLHHMWEAPKKMDDPGVARAAYLESGLDADRLLARAQDQDVKDALIKNTESAVARGAFGIPTFFVNDEMFFGKDRLRDVEDGIVRAQAAA